ncbi:hypothetical protein [Chondrinema litorale]|uniref:hypothetical protein n=1 Tax=Chondrinema litorale TaxID=2994555 RepID=UPI00254294E1|nr:hypothetical protein [Chondrinema litorale]UZR98435.1 hypothetical protein OQ292_31850 [Chondrinema litorale]
MPKKKFATALLYFLFSQAYCQSNLPSTSPIVINASILDTIEIKLNSTVMHMQWLNDTIEVCIQNKNLKMDTTVTRALRESFNDSTILTSQEDIDDFLLSMKTGAQNCYSYALEKYFDNNEAINQNIFGKSTHIGRKTGDKILANYFKEIHQLSTSPKRNLKATIPNDALLAFINKSGWAIHYVYYRDDIFYSKNGSFKPIEFQSLKKFLKKHYWDTEKIIFYKIDEEKIKST